MKSEVKTKKKKKKGLNLKKCLNFREFEGETTKKKQFLLQNLQRKKQFLLKNSWVTSILPQFWESLRSPTAISSTKPVNLFWVQYSLRDPIFGWGGTSNDLGWGHDLGMLSRGAGPASATYQLETTNHLHLASFQVTKYFWKKRN